MAASNSLNAGSAKVWVLEDGIFITDAGNFFGGSGNAKIKGAMRPVLVETEDNLVLLDAGFGPELPAILKDRYELRHDNNSLIDRLEETGYSPEDVTHIVLSHLDADHVGWALRCREFPNATVYLQEADLEEARDLPKSNARRDVVPVVEEAIEEGWLELLDGSQEIVPGVTVEARPGHTAGHQVVWIGSGDELVLYSADLAPAKIWLDPDLISGAATDPEAAQQNRIEVLSEAESRDATVILYHEPKDFLVKVRKTDESFQAEPVSG